MDSDRLKLEAERLSKDAVFVEAISRIRAAAIEQLIAADASNTSDIMRLQAVAKVCDGIASELATMIMSSHPRKPNQVT